MKISTAKYLELIRETIHNVLKPDLRSESAQRLADIVCGAVDELLKRETTTLDIVLRALPDGLAVADKLIALDSTATAQEMRARIEEIRADMNSLARRTDQMSSYRKMLDVLETLSQGVYERDLDDPSPGSDTDLRPLAEAAEWENRVEQAQLRKRELDVVTRQTSAGPEPFTAGTLLRFIQDVLPMEEALEVTDFELVPAGMVHETYQFTLRSAIRPAEQMIVRKNKGEPFARMNCFELHKEFDLVKALARANYLLPEALWLGRDIPGVSGDFYVMRKANGSKNADLFNVSSPIPETVLLEMAERLAQLHALPLETFAEFIDLHEDPSCYSHTAQQATLRNLGQWYDCWRQFTRQPSVAEVYIFAWLMKHVPTNSRRASILHTDYTPHNCLWEKEHLTAVLDWEGAHFGDPVEDLAYIKPHIEGRMSWDKFLRHYQEHGGAASVEDKQIAYFTCYAQMRTVVLGNVFVSRVETGQTRDLIGLQVDYEYVPRTLEMCIQSMRSFGD
jgi:aminoglycoside phosphotransferase (APT) family kinase protein